MKARSWARRSSVEVKVPRRNNLRTRILNQISTWFNHEQCLGVETKRMRWVGSHRKAARVAMDSRMPVLSLVPRSSAYPRRSATKRTSDSDWWVFNCSVTKTHSASGSVATVRSICAAKSAAVRVGPTVGATTRPCVTSQVAIRHWVPWRTYSHSRRATRPGRTGRVGAARASAWMPVISSVLTTCPPRAWMAGAAASTVQIVSIPCASSAGSRSRGVRQYRLSCGLIAAASKNQEPPDTAGGDAWHDVPFDRLVSQFAGRPLTDGPPRIPRRLAGDGHHLAELLRRKRRRRPGAWRVRQHIADHLRQRAVVVLILALSFRHRHRLTGCRPAPSPRAGGVRGHPHPAPRRRIGRAVGGGEDDPCPPDLVRRTRVPPHHLLEHSPLARGGRD